MADLTSGVRPSAGDKWAEPDTLHVCEDLHALWEKEGHHAEPIRHFVRKALRTVVTAEEYAAATESGTPDFGLVDDEAVRGAQELQDVAETCVFEVTALAIKNEEARLISFNSWKLRDLRRWQFEIKVFEPHGGVTGLQRGAERTMQTTPAG